MNELHRQSIEIRKDPKLAYNIIEPTGEFRIVFDEDIIGITFLKDLKKSIESRGTVIDESGRRRLGHITDANTFDLNEYLVFEVFRGGEDSADVDALRFNVSSTRVEQDELELLISFENP